jgi:hypothetical protein
MAADLHNHLFDYDIDSDGDYQVPAAVGVGNVSAMGSAHNHGDSDLTIATITVANESNCDVELSSAASLFEPIAPDASEIFSLTITPAAYGPWSFDLVFASNDPDSPMTVTFEGKALGPAEDDEVWRAPNRRRDWTAAPRRRHWTILG